VRCGTEDKVGVVVVCVGHCVQNLGIGARRVGATVVGVNRGNTAGRQGAALLWGVKVCRRWGKGGGGVVGLLMIIRVSDHRITSSLQSSERLGVESVQVWVVVTVTGAIGLEAQRLGEGNAVDTVGLVGFSVKDVVGVGVGVRVRVHSGDTRTLRAGNSGNVWHVDCKKTKDGIMVMTFDVRSRIARPQTEGRRGYRYCDC
jgi:hypothetical protein